MQVTRKIKRFISELKYFIYFLMPYYFREWIAPSLKKSLYKTFLASHKVSEEANNFLYGASGFKSSFFVHFKYKFEHHLHWTDRSRIWFLLESRFPFLVHLLTEKNAQTPKYHLRYTGRTKWIQRQGDDNLNAREIWKLLYLNQRFKLNEI
jgi:hypothetical protein